MIPQPFPQAYETTTPAAKRAPTFPNIFRDLDSDTGIGLNKTVLPDTKIWELLYSFQNDGAKTAISKIRDFNGCVLADSVGLDKTYTALIVIKYFELTNERVLVLYPKKLHRN